MNNKETIAVVGGLGTLAGGDLFFKLIKNKKVLENQLNYHFVFEQQPYSQINIPLHTEADIKSRQFYSYNSCKDFENKNVTKILLPCFASHSFIKELQEEIHVPIVNIYDAIVSYLHNNYPAGTKVGILTSDFVKNHPLSTSYLAKYNLVYPSNQRQIMDAIYAKDGIKYGYFEGLNIEYIAQACEELLAQECAVILPLITEIALITPQLRSRGIPVIDVNQLYADYALEDATNTINKAFKIGIVGGVGPSATVDFMNKIVRNTVASKDQDHLKMVVEQNPQIPDRTANIVHNQTDPTIALYSTCKKLEAEGAHAIAIPCNTAHAFVESIQKNLNIPIVNMLTVTAEHIENRFGPTTNVGLLATDGTIQSNVYGAVLIAYGFKVVMPDEHHQQLVMESIYGKRGVKAGFETGVSKHQIDAAVNHLIDLGADLIILGCTELPLLFPDEREIVKNNKSVALVDPTLILAQRMVEIATKGVHHTTQ